VDIVTAGYHRSRNRPEIDDDELIDNPEYHFRYRGVKFANPEVVLDQKDFYRREKDVRDLEEAGRKLGTSEPTAFNPAFYFAACTEALLRLTTGVSPPETGARATVKNIVRRVRRRLTAAVQRH